MSTEVKIKRVDYNPCNLMYDWQIDGDVVEIIIFSGVEPSEVPLRIAHALWFAANDLDDFSFLSFASFDPEEQPHQWISRAATILDEGE